MRTAGRPLVSADRRQRGLGRRARRRVRRPSGQRGVAILAVITAIAIAMMLINEFGTRTNTDLIQARNTLDQSRAHFLARSALNLGELLLRMQKAIDDIPANVKAGLGLPPDVSVAEPEFAGQIMGAFGGGDEEVMEAIGVASMDDVQGLGANIGTFNITLAPVDGKINVNCAGGSAPEKRRVALMLKSLFFPFATNAMFDEEDAEGWRRDFETQVEAIIDYIDEDTNHVDVSVQPGSGSGSDANAPLPQGGGEDYGYETLRDRYQPKNRRIDSVGELRLVRGIDDRMWMMFAGALRAHGGCQISVRALDDVTVIAAVISASMKDDEPAVRNDPGLIWKLAALVVQAKALRITFPSIQDFSKFIADPRAELEAMMQSAQASGATEGLADIAALIRDPNMKGVELVDDKLRKVLTDQPPRAYQVEAYGIIERPRPFLPIVRTIRGMWDQRAPLQNKRWQGNPSAGAWQWLREE